jgi:hypothetical protein
MEPLIMKKGEPMSWLPENCISAELAHRTKYSTLRRALDGNKISVVVRGYCWYTKNCPKRFLGMIRREMKRLLYRLYPRFEYTY